MDDAELRLALATAEALRGVHTFAAAKWTGPHKGPRGGTYWLRAGAKDIEANRVYGEHPEGETSLLGRIGRVAVGGAVGAMAGFGVGGPTGAVLGGLIGAGSDLLVPDKRRR